MHTETDTTAAEAYVTAHRAHIAILGWGLITPLAIIVWVLFLDIVCHISSTNLNWASAILISLGMGIAALAFYWGGDES